MVRRVSCFVDALPGRQFVRGPYLDPFPMMGIALQFFAEHGTVILDLRRNLVDLVVLFGRVRKWAIELVFSEPDFDGDQLE